MSRIERAIEEATRYRNELQSERKQPERRACALPAKPFSVEEINIDDPYFITVHAPHSHGAEEFRKLKSMVVKIMRQESESNVIMVTSALGGEGKSMTSLNLAITLSQEYNYTTLLVDADFRKPTLAKLLKIDSDKGLSDCLISGDDLGSVMIKTGIGSLSFVPAGELVENPVELFSSDQMKECMDEMRRRYRDRIIIIDTPPALPFAETRIISELADKVIAVVREGSASLHNVSETLNIIGHSRVLGVVYNNVRSTGNNNNYNYYYGYDRTQIKESD